MALRPGDSLGPYDIVSALGAGGMGEVYRARDRKLNRDVALKVLPASVADDSDRIARFEREARLLASLSHANIGHIYGLEDSTRVRALVLELIEGPTLAERIARRAMPLDEAMTIAWQIADALAAAHALGVVHRDLKPANVKLRPDGTVKVLDFGLAKALEPLAAGAVSVTSTASPISPGDTREGMILGSVAYMSPEQARGEPVDVRTDIWSFGVVLFEMLTGAPPFAGRTASDVFAALLQREPDYGAVPARVRPLLEACLEKDPSKRLRDIADARLLVRAADQQPAARPSRGWLPWAATGAFVVIAAVAVWAPWRKERPAPQLVRFHITPQGSIPVSAASAISPNGRYFAYMSTGSDGVLRVWLRDLRSFEDRPLQGTEIGQAAPPPFWSPDSRFVAYDAGGALMKVDVVAGGLPQLICRLSNPAVGGSWNGGGVILFGNTIHGIYRVPAAGGTPAVVTVPDPSRMERVHLMPTFLPDGRHFFYLRISRSDPTLSGIFVGSLDVEPEKQDLTRLVATPTNVKYAPAPDGRVGQLLTVRDGNLFAQRFDERQLQLTGEPVLVAEGVHSYLDGATVSVSDNGVLAYLAASGESQFSWFDRKGQLLSQFPERGRYSAFSLAQDDNRGVTVRINPQATATAAVWLLDFAGRTTERLAMGGQSAPIWSHDQKRVIFTSYQGGLEGTLMTKAIGSAEREAELFRAGDRIAPTSVSPDGRHLLYVAVNSKTNADIWTLALEGTAQATPVLTTPAAETQAQFAPVSPEPWVAFTSNESGRDEVYLTSFPKAANRLRVSNGGGHSPRWRRDGRELFYIAGDGMLTAVPLTAQGEPGVATPLFRVPADSTGADATGRRLAMPWDVAGDGRRFLFTVPTGGGRASAFSIVLNWQNQLPH